MRRATLFFLVLTLGFMLFTIKGISSTEKVDHYGQVVEISGNISDCVVCHDGTIASNSSFCIKSCDLNTAHSVDKSYPPRGQEGSYAPVSSIWGKGIRLYDGKTTCLSCHNLKNPEKFHLVIDNSGSTLCFTCHVNK